MKLLFGFELTRPRPHTALHPDFKTLVEFAFKIKGVSYYGFKDVRDMPPKRYEKMNQFIKELDMRIDSRDILEDIGLIKKAADKGRITDIILIINSLELRVGQYIETDTFHRLFSCAYFPLDEDLEDYDYDVNETKIAVFKAEPPGDFFFMKPIRKYLPQIDISSKDFHSFSELTKLNKLKAEKIKSEVLKGLSETGNESGGQ